ncbi:MAG: nucleoside monophosphate kinase [Candidatus Aenigmatarchaeota archaeon]
MRFLIFGPPGAGKGTYTTRLKDILGIAAISTGDVFRDAIKQDTPLGQKVKQYLDSGQLVPDEVVIGVLRDWLGQPETQKGFILDGYPRTLKQAQDLEKLTPIDAVINLVVPEWVIVERLSSRRVCKQCGTIYNVRFLKPKVEGVCDKCGGPLIQRPDDMPDVIKERIKLYEATTKPLLEFFENAGMPIVSVECNEVDVPPEIIVDKILNALRERKLIK